MLVTNRAKPSALPTRIVILLVAGLLATAVMLAIPKSASAINCSFGAHAPTTDGLWAYGHSSMDCYSYQTDWLKGFLYEWFGPVEI